jgi:AcrR family transcriptional regulator
MPRSEKASEQRNKRRAEILRAARGVFADKGYHEAGVSDIIDAAGVARGTFYLYFDSKYAIFEELLDQVARAIRQGIRPVDLSPGAASPESQLLANATWLLSLLRSEPEMLRILLWEASGLDRELDRRLAAFYADLFTLTRRSLDKGVATGLLRTCDTEIGARCLIGAVKELMLSLLIRKDLEDEEPAVLARKFLDFTLGGLLLRTT